MEAGQHVGLFFGGRSSEHEISTVSAQSVFRAMDTQRYDVTLVRINRQGQWELVAGFDRADAHPEAAAGTVCLVPGGRLIRQDGGALNVQPIDVAFPVLHGPNGEDGTIQGLLRLYDIPCVGANVLGSAIGMDKDVMKRLFREAGIPTPDFRVMHREDEEKWSYAQCVEALGSPLFVKPANTGSSVGISKVKTEAAYHQALALAFSFDSKVLIETAVVGRELECAVMGPGPLRVSVCGEITTRCDFYTYEAKYENEEATDLIIPADIPEQAACRMRQLALQACRTLGCEGMARVDFFMDQEGQLLVNEINTIPGFTSGSMFPRLWEHSGLSFSELIDARLEDAITRHERDQALKQMHR